MLGNHRMGEQNYLGDDNGVFQPLDEPPVALPEPASLVEGSFSTATDPSRTGTDRDGYAKVSERIETP